MRWLLSLAAASAVASSGCTTILNSASPSDGISQGYSYQLPRIAYEAKVTRVLSACPESATQKVEFDMTATASSTLSRGETFVIDYLATSSATKGTDFVMKSHPNGMLKSINLTVNDKTADIVKGSVKAIVGVAKIAIGLPSTGGAASGGEVPSGPTPYLRCSRNAQTTLASLPGLKAAVKTAEVKLKASEKALSDLETASKTGKPAPAKDLAALTKAARDDGEARDKVKKSLAEAISALTLVQSASIEVPSAGASFTFELKNATGTTMKPGDFFVIYRPTDDVRGFLIPLNSELRPDISATEPEGYSTDAKDAAEVTAARTRLLTQLEDQGDQLQSVLTDLANADATFIAVRLGSDPAPLTLATAKSCSNDKAGCGVVYRSPAPGRVRVCSGNGAEACKARITGESAILFQEERLVPQFGRLAALPLVNGPFTNNTLTAEFTEDGQISEMAYKKPDAEAVGAVTALNDVVDGATQAITYKKGKALRDLKDKKALYDAELEAEQAKAKLTPSELQKLKDQKELVEAQIALAEAQERAKPEQPSQVTAIENETLLLEAQADQIDALIELRKAEKELQDLQKGIAPAP